MAALCLVRAALAWSWSEQPRTLNPSPLDLATVSADSRTPKKACDLCARDFIIVLATGRSGSTSLLETLNSLPGVQLRGVQTRPDPRLSRSHLTSSPMLKPTCAVRIGENHASIWAAYDLYKRAASSFPEGETAPFEHGNVSNQELLCALQDFFVAFDPPTERKHSEPTLVHGFKELVIPSAMGTPAVNLDAENHLTDGHEASPEHLPAHEHGWIDFLQELFPCAKIILNMRRDTAAQAKTEMFRRKSVTKLMLDQVNEVFASWHRRITNARMEVNVRMPRSYLMALEEFTPEGATQLAQWLGFPCSFDALPHANDPDSYDSVAPAPTSRPKSWGKDYFMDYGSVKMTCDSSQRDRNSHSSQRLYSDALTEMPCAPSVATMTRLIAPTENTQFKLARAPFFLHETGVFNMSDSLACIRQIAEAADDDDPVTLGANVAEHMTDIQLVQRLREHPLRVQDPAQARLHVIGAPLVSVFHFLWHVNELRKLMSGASSAHPTLKLLEACGKAGTLEYHRARAREMAAALKALPAFKEHSGRNFLALGTSYLAAQAFGPDLLQLLLVGPALFTSSDKYYHLPGQLGVATSSWLSRADPIILPYKASALMEKDAWERPSSTVDTAPRPTKIMFRGRMERECGGRHLDEEGCLRGSVLSGIASRLNASLNVSIASVNAEKIVFDRAATSRLSEETLSMYTHSDFCLVPAGDTPTSRRLYDALASGCVPVVLADFERIAPNLPFPRSIDWTRPALFLGSLACLNGTMEALANKLTYLAKLNESTPNALHDLHQLKWATRQVFRSRLSYTRGSGIVDGLLLEVEARLDQLVRNDIVTAPAESTIELYEETESAQKEPTLEFLHIPKVADSLATPCCKLAVLPTPPCEPLSPSRLRCRADRRIDHRGRREGHRLQMG